MHPVLTARGIGKAFPGVRALDGVDLTLRSGEIHSLMGENGAGKSTLIKIISGVFAPDSGSIELDGKVIHPRSTMEATKLGISTVFQEVNLVPNLTVAENVFLGREPTKVGFLNWRTMRTRAQETLARMGLELDAESRLGQYSVAVQQLVAISRALDVDSKVLILDEPTSSLDGNDVQRLFTVLNKLKADGLSIVFISHFLEQIYAISDRLTVLRNGRLVGEFEAAALPRYDLIEKMLGRELTETQRISPERQDRSQKTSLEVDSLAKKGVLKATSFRMNQGEVVGVAGLVGSGRSEMATMVFGLNKADRGSVRLNGKLLGRLNVRNAIRSGLGMLPEDRKSSGIFPNLSVRQNIVLAHSVARGIARPLSRKKQNEIVKQYIDTLRIATPSAETPVGNLSGGNQQKVLLARWLASKPGVLLLDEPTRGVDVGAKAEIEALIQDLATDGLSILHIASDLEEVERNCSRVLVMHDRQIVGELVGDQIQIESILQLIAADHDEAR